MTKKILFNPGILVDYRVWHLCIDMEVVNSFRCQVIILCIEYLESTGSLLIPICEKGSTLHYKLFFLCVIDDLLYKFSAERIVAINRSEENPNTGGIDDIFIQFSIESFLKKYFVFGINLNKHFECIDCSINTQS